MSDSPPETPNPAVRFRVSYKTPEALLGEFTKSVGRGSVALPSGRAVPLGTRFIFELSLDGAPQPVEVTGEVVRVLETGGGKYLLTVRYDPTTDRTGVDALLKQIADAHAFEKVRAFARIPLKMRATEETPYSPSYLVQDISRGGLRMEVESPTLPDAVKVGEAFMLELWLSIGTLMLHGEIVWTAPGGSKERPNPTFGVRFGKLREATIAHLARLLSLHVLPPPPWKGRLSFGMDAITRMP